MEMIEMRHYVTINKNGLVEVQNVVMGIFGQKHTHTKKDFENWKKGIDEKYIIYLNGEKRNDKRNKNL